MLTVSTQNPDDKEAFWVFVCHCQNCRTQVSSISCRLLKDAKRFVVNSWRAPAESPPSSWSPAVSASCLKVVNAVEWEMHIFLARSTRFKYFLASAEQNLDSSWLEYFAAQQLWLHVYYNKRLCYCRGTARRATSVEILWPFFDGAIDKKLC